MGDIFGGRSVRYVGRHSDEVHPLAGNHRALGGAILAWRRDHPARLGRGGLVPHPLAADTRNVALLAAVPAYRRIFRAQAGQHGRLEAGTERRSLPRHVGLVLGVRDDHHDGVGGGLERRNAATKVAERDRNGRLGVAVATEGHGSSQSRGLPRLIQARLVEDEGTGDVMGHLIAIEPILGQGLTDLGEVDFHAAAAAVQRPQTAVGCVAALEIIAAERGAQSAQQLDVTVISNESRHRNLARRIVGDAGERHTQRAALLVVRELRQVVPDGHILLLLRESIGPVPERSHNVRIPALRQRCHGGDRRRHGRRRGEHRWRQSQGGGKWRENELGGDGGGRGRGDLRRGGGRRRGDSAGGRHEANGCLVPAPPPTPTP